MFPRNPILQILAVIAGLAIGAGLAHLIIAEKEPSSQPFSSTSCRSPLQLYVDGFQSVHKQVGQLRNGEGGWSVASALQGTANNAYIAREVGLTKRSSEGDRDAFVAKRENHYQAILFPPRCWRQKYIPSGVKPWRPSVKVTFRRLTPGVRLP